MKRNLVKIDDYLFVMGDHYKSDKFPYLVIEKLNTGEYSIWQVDNPNDWDEKTQYQILVHVPLNGAPYLHGVDVLPRLNQDDEVDKLAEERFPIKNEAALDIIECLQIKQEVYAEGYNKAREKYKFTEEDMMEVMEIYSDWVQDVDSDTFYKTYKLKLRQVIQSLQQPKYPIAFESEVEPKFKHIGSTKEVKGSGSRIKNKHAGNPKTFINSEGRTEWVGKYIYE
jgi:hypothetical protein